jgi:hypothetical protein
MHKVNECKTEIKDDDKVGKALAERSTLEPGKGILQTMKYIKSRRMTIRCYSFLSISKLLFFIFYL